MGNFKAIHGKCFHAAPLVAALALTSAPTLAQTGGGRGGEGGSGSLTEHQGPGHVGHPVPGTGNPPPVGPSHVQHNTIPEPGTGGSGETGGGVGGGSGASSEHRGPGHQGMQTNDTRPR